MRPRRIRSRPSRSVGAGRDAGQRRPQPEHLVRAVVRCHLLPGRCLCRARLAHVSLGGPPSPGGRTVGRLLDAASAGRPGSVRCTVNTGVQSCTPRSSTRSAASRSGTPTTSMPSTVRDRRRRRACDSAGTIAQRKPSRRPRRAAAGCRGTRRSSPARPDLADRDHVGGDVALLPGRGDRDAPRRGRRRARRSGRRRRSRRRRRGCAAGSGPAAGARPRTIATREASSPDVVRRGRSAVAGVTSAWISASIGRRPSRATADAGAGHRLVVPGDEQPGRVGDRDDAVAGEVEAADLVDRAEAVLDRPDHPQPGAALALEVQHHVDEVLEHPGAGDAAVLGDVADQHGGDVLGLGHPDQRGGDLLDLGDPAGDAVDVGGADGLHRVDDQQVGLDRLDVAEHGAEVGLGGEVTARRGRRRCGRRAAAPGRRTPRR